MPNKDERVCDRIGGLIWLVLGVAISLESIRLGIGQLTKPGPGFMPLLCGAILGLFGLTLIGSSMSARNSENEERAASLENPNRNWRLPLVTLFILFGYFLLLDRVGFYIASFAFLLLLFKLTNEHWRSPILYAAFATVLTYLVLARWLMVQLPSGVLGL